jgi:type I restriction enzyme S subunit
MKGIYPYYGASGIIDYVNDYIFDDDLILLGEDGENILSRNCRLVYRVSGKIWVNNHAHVLKPKSKEYDIDFLTELLESLNYEKYNSGTAQPKLNQQSCSSIILPLPPTREEQKGIAIILSDMSSEIEALEQERDKCKLLKAGLMQQLLTGRIRLKWKS